MELTTTLNIDFVLRKKYYIKKENLGVYTSFSTQRSYLKFECQKHLSFFCISPLGALLQYIIFSTNMRVIFLPLSQFELRVVNGTWNLSD